MSYVIWMAILAVIAALLFTAQRTFPETRDYRGSKILLLASLLKPGGALILALMVFFNVLVESRVIQNFKDETVKYKSVEIAPNRENIRKAVRGRLEKELSPFSIEVVDLLLDNIDFNPEFKKAIEDKQIATQRALEEQQKIEGEKHKAQQAIERAKGEGSAILFRAEKEAEANRKLAASLTPELVPYAMVQKLSDKIQVMMLPSGQNFILDSDILRGAPREKR